MSWPGRVEYPMGPQNSDIGPERSACKLSKINSPLTARTLQKQTPLDREIPHGLSSWLTVIGHLALPSFAHFQLVVVKSCKTHSFAMRAHVGKESQIGKTSFVDCGSFACLSWGPSNLLESARCFINAVFTHIITTHIRTVRRVRSCACIVILCISCQNTLTRWTSNYFSVWLHAMINFCFFHLFKSTRPSART